MGNGQTENLNGLRGKNAVPTTTLGVKRSALGEIGNKVVARSNSTATTKPGTLVNQRELIKPVQRSNSTRSLVPVKPPTCFVRPLPKPNVTSRVKRTDSNTSVASVVLPVPAPRSVPSVQETAAVAQTVEIEDVDKADESNSLLVANYVFEIYEYLYSLEEKFPIKRNYLEGQQISPRMRATLVDWLVDVQLQYHLLQETLYLAVQILDRYLQAVPTVSKKYLQLAGVAAMYVACKYEEVYMPDISDFVYITDSAYTKQQLLAMEVQIVKTLEFEFSRPISLTFLRRFSKVVEAHPIHHCFSKYFLELAMMEYSLCHVRPSLVAAAALYISLCICELNKISGPQHWDAKMVHYSSYKLEEVEAAAKDLARVIVSAPNSKFEAVKKKYSQSKMMKVSTRTELQCDALKRLSEGKSAFP